MTEEYWKGVLRRYIASDMKQQDFCLSESVSFSKFKYYWQRFGKMLLKESLPTDKDKSFEPVVIKAKPPQNSADTIVENITVKFPNAMQCQFDFKGSIRGFANLLKEINGLC